MGTKVRTQTILLAISTPNCILINDMVHAIIMKIVHAIISEIFFFFFSVVKTENFMKTFLIFLKFLKR